MPNFPLFQKFGFQALKNKKNTKMWFYNAIWFVLSVVLRVFFRTVDRHGTENIPKHGAVIFAGNHTNGLIDPAVLVTTCPRALHFMAKSSLFKPLCGCVGVLMKGAGAIPVYRKQDGGGDNSSSFRAVDDVLASGHCFAIFPEGISHGLPEIQELKTGIARMALDFLAKHPDATLSIVPCGLNYVAGNKFRSKVWVRYGVAMPVAGDIPTLMDNLADAMHRVTVNAHDWDTVELIHLTAKLYRPSSSYRKFSFGAWLHLSSRISSVYSDVKDEPRVVTLRYLVQHYHDRIAALDITDDLVCSGEGLSTIGFVIRFAGYLLCFLVLVPMAVPVMILNLPISFPARYFGNRLAKKETDVIATFKVLIAFVLTPLVHITYIVVGAWLLSEKANLSVSYEVWLPCLIVGLPLVSFAALLLYERGWNYYQSLFDITVLWNHEAEIKALRKTRDGLTEYVRAFVFALATHQEKSVLDTMMPSTCFESPMTQEGAEELLARLAHMSRNVSDVASMDKQRYTYRADCFDTMAREGSIIIANGDDKTVVMKGTYNTI